MLFFNYKHMGSSCAAKSWEPAKYYQAQAEVLGCHFMDAAGCEFNSVDFMHLSRRGHAQLAERLAALVPQLLL